MTTQTETAFNFRMNGYVLGFKDEARSHGPKGTQLTTNQPIRKYLCGNYDNSGRHVTLFLIRVTTLITTTNISTNQTVRHKMIY